LILPGAFAASLAEYKAKGTMPGMYAEHSIYTPGGDLLPIGRWLDMGECELLKMQMARIENSKANRIETMKGPAESGQSCSVGRRKIAKKIAKNKRCYANNLRPRSRMLLKVMKGG
jgi:hypothetical protein